MVGVLFLISTINKWYYGSNKNMYLDFTKWIVHGKALPTIFSPPKKILINIFNTK